MGRGDSAARVTTYETTRRDGSAAPNERAARACARTSRRGEKRQRSTAPERMLRGRAVVPAVPTVRRDPYWQDVVKLSGSATTVTPRIVAPTRTSWPFGRVVARTGPIIGSRIGIAAILR